MVTFFQIYYDHKHEKVFGFYSFVTPSLCIADVDLIKDVLVKDADCFVNRTTFDLNDKDKILQDTLLQVTGEKWKALRNLLTPIFSSGKLKRAFPLIKERAEILIENCRKRNSEDGYVEMREMIGKYTMDVIASCIFGIEIECYGETKSKFIQSCDEATKPSVFDIVKFLIYLLSKRLFNALGLSFLKKSTKHLVQTVEETIKIRIKGGIKRNDFLDLLLELLESQKIIQESGEKPQAYGKFTRLEDHTNNTIN